MFMVLHLLRSLIGLDIQTEKDAGVDIHRPPLLGVSPQERGSGGSPQGRMLNRTHADASIYEVPL